MNTTEVTTLKEYIELMAGMMAPHQKIPEGYKYGSQYAFVADQGTQFSNEPLTAAEKKVLRPVLTRMARMNPKVKVCFMNAFHLSEMGEAAGIEYAEGFAQNIIPCNHAWGVLNGKVIDVTWRKLEDRRRASGKVLMERVEKNLAENSYMGIKVPLDYLRRRYLATETYVSAVDDYAGEFPLMREGFSFDAK